jgi:UDP-N-acetylmuramoyl-L-alanyl-D-glutamate--2,6-diaminopimelate ligase
MTGQRLSALLVNINIIEQHGPADPLISSLAYDSREVEEGGLFFALRGLHSDGHRFITAAVERGAAAVVCMELPPEISPGTAYILVENSRTVMSPISAVFYKHPSSELTVIGVTGTDGKSTTCYYIQQLLQGRGKKTGLLTTVQFDVGEGPEKNYLRQSTPEPPDVHRLLREMRNRGCTHAVVEATSHGLSKLNNRLGDVRFDVGVLTNISHEHLDFHKTLERYIDDKANLFRALPAQTGRAVVNLDDPHHDAFVRAAACPVLTYSVKTGTDTAACGTDIAAASGGDSAGADLVARDIRESPGRLDFTLLHPGGESALGLPQPGRFNVENCLAALLAVSSLPGEKLADFLPLTEKLRAIRGRMVPVKEGQDFEVLVDYAHTPGSFQKLFPALRERVRGRLIAVFGSAGERDRAKRPILGRIAAEHADLIVLTDEDPRGEIPRSILEEIAAGCGGFEEGKDLFLIEDRPSAIARAFSMAGKNDLVVLLGKGHEGSIIYSDGPRPWDEEEEARRILKTMYTAKGSV